MRASASKTALLLSPCKYWAREDVPLPPEKKSAAASFGTKVHALIAEFIVNNKQPSFELADRVLNRALQGISIARLHGGSRAEMAFATRDVGTKLLGEMIPRDAYPPDAFCGTADFIFQDEVGWHLRDWKTGQQGDGEAWQLRALAAMSYESGTKMVDAKAIYLTDTAPRFGENVLEGTDPVEDAATIRKHLRLIPESAPQPGTHCKALWCQLRTTCKAVV